MANVRSTHSPNTLRAGKRAIVQAACEACRARKTACDVIRPSCTNCVRRGTICAYRTQNAEETRQMAQRRKLETLQTELQQFKDFVEYLKSAPADNVLKCLGRSAHDSAIGEDVSSAVVLPQSMAFQHSISGGLSPRHSISHARPNLEHLLSSCHSNIYPTILAFEAPQAVAENLLGARGSRRMKEIVRRKFETRAHDSTLLSLPSELCDPRLRGLDINYWTEVAISNDHAAAAISHYFQTEHPAIALFDAGLFVGDMVYRRHDYCSRFLVNALLSYAVQAWRILDPSAWDMHVKAKRTWQSENIPDSFLNLAALRLMDYSGATGGFDLEARFFNQLSNELVERLHLSQNGDSAGDLPNTGFISDELRFRAHVAWGYFASASISTFFYNKPLPKPPLSLPIPGTQMFHLPLYMGSTFASVCKLFLVAEHALAFHVKSPTLGVVDFEVVESSYGMLFDWAADLPDCCARNNSSPHHVLTMHVYYHCIVMFLVRPWMGTGQQIRLSSGITCVPDEVYHASLHQLKRILILYQLDYPESRYHAWWNPAMIYVSHAVLTSRTDREWQFYFLVCLQAFRTLSIVYPFAAISYKAMLTMAIAEGKLSARKARDLLRQLLHRKDGAIVQDTPNLRTHMQLGNSAIVYDNSDAEGLAGDFESLAVALKHTSDGQVNK